MRLSLITALSLATSSLALTIVPRDGNNAMDAEHNKPGGGGEGGAQCKRDEGGQGGGQGGGAEGGGGKPGEGGKGGKGGSGMKECNSFRLRTKGSVSGWVGQLESGQLRIGLQPVILRMERGEVVDDRRRGMWWTVSCLSLFAFSLAKIRYTDHVALAPH